MTVIAPIAADLSLMADALDASTGPIEAARLAEAAALHAIEGNPLDPAELELFRAFEEGGLLPAQRRAAILAIAARSSPAA